MIENETVPLQRPAEPVSAGHRSLHRPAEPVSAGHRSEDDDLDEDVEASHEEEDTDMGMVHDEESKER